MVELCCTDGPSPHTACCLQRSGGAVLQGAAQLLQSSPPEGLLLTTYEGPFGSSWPAVYGCRLEGVPCDPEGLILETTTLSGL